MKVEIILANVEAGKIALPAFQRGYVWKRRQVREFFDSLYRRHPVGSLLTWLTSRDNGTTAELLLDGQQRVTSLYGVIKGRPPDFFSGDDKAFRDLHFHAVKERFEFLQPIKMKDDPLWFDVTKVMQAGVNGIADLMEYHLAVTDAARDFKSQMEIMNRLTRLLAVTGVNLHVEQVTDEKHTIDTVVSIFNRLNSAGTRLSSGDLALARIAAKWPEVRDEMGELVEEWKGHDFHFTLDWLLRCVNAVVNGEAAFQHLHDTPGSEVKVGLQRTVKHVNAVLNQISNKLGLDHDRVLFGRFSIPVLVRHLELRSHGPISAEEWNRLLYWFLQAGMRGRFSGTTETKIRQDLVAVDGTMDGMERLIADIGTKWGRRQVAPSDFDAWSLGARLYPALYWLTRVGGARNFCDGSELKAGLLGKGSRMEVHHIFPKAVLYEAGYERSQVNALGNFCLLTADCNKWIGAACPAEPSPYVKGKHDPDLRRSGLEGYFSLVRERNPGALESQWIPMDEELWKVKNYPAFLDARRRLLADAANLHLAALYPGHSEMEVAVGRPLRVEEEDASGAPISSAQEEEILEQLQKWLASRRLPLGELGYELRSDPDHGIEAIIDLAWPNGLPEGRGRPVALLLNESAETYRTVSQAGFDCHTNVQAFMQFLDGEIVGEAAVAVA
ncbi:MAG: DUF262 domain-containing protein [Gemmatimonadetes bacterium]|nr:DUF262 domain-containing protein [Gemmatimonadota bacterium]